MTPRFRYIKIQELAAYGQSEEYLRLAILPITPQRIASQIDNPRASGEDIGLILAENEKGEVLGFIGLLPDFLFFPIQQKVYWISCWWVDKEKGKNLGVPLLYAAYKLCEGRLVADSIPDTLPVFEKSKLFHIASPKRGLRLFLQPCLEKIISRKQPQWTSGSTFKWFEKVSRALFSPFLYAAKLKNNYPKGFQIEYLEMVDERVAEFIRTHSSTEYFQRGMQELNWMVALPWLTTEKMATSACYPFSSKVVTFTSHLICLSKEEKIHAFFYFTERDGSFKLPYVYFEPRVLPEVTQFIEAFLYKKGAEEFTCFHPLLADALHLRFPFAFHRRLDYQYVWGKGLETITDLKKFQDGDGDAVFT